MIPERAMLDGCPQLNKFYLAAYAPLINVLFLDVHLLF